MYEAFIGLGGNVGDVHSTFLEALRLIRALPSVFDVRVSRFYRTTPVSPIPQDDFLNAVCRLKTSMGVKDLFHALQGIQCALGQTFKEQDAPRKIDLDLLFFGSQCIDTPHLKVPHPRWRERLFVLVPLADVVSHLFVAGEAIDIHEEIRHFKNRYRETVIEEPEYAANSR